MTPELPFIEEVRQRSEEATAELLDIALEEAEASPAAAALGVFMQNDAGFTIAQSLVFQALRAAGVCAFDVVNEDVSDRQTLLDLIAAHPELAWGLDLFRQEILLEDINPELTGESLAAARARFNSWLRAG